MGVVYFFAGIAKLNPDWLQGLPLKLWLPAKTDAFLIGPLLKYEFTAYFMSYTGALIDLGTPFLLLFRKTRSFAFIVATMFHITNALIFNIGIFPYLSIALNCLIFCT